MPSSIGQKLLPGVRSSPEEWISNIDSGALCNVSQVGDLPDADIRPPENVLFVCKLNPVTTDEDLEIIFSRFGPISRFLDKTNQSVWT